MIIFVNVFCKLVFSPTVTPSFVPPFLEMQKWILTDENNGSTCREHWEEIVDFYNSNGHLFNDVLKPPAKAVSSRIFFLAFELLSQYLNSSNNLDAFLFWPKQSPDHPLITRILPFFLSLFIKCSAGLLATFHPVCHFSEWDRVIAFKLLDFLPLSLRIEAIPLWSNLLVCHIESKKNYDLLSTNEWEAISFFREIPYSYFRPYLPLLIASLKKDPHNIDAEDIFTYILCHICNPTEELSVLFFLRDILLSYVKSFDNPDLSDISPRNHNYHFFCYLESCSYFFSRLDIFNTPSENIIRFLLNIIPFCKELGWTYSWP